MNTYEKLRQVATDEGLDVIEYSFSSVNIKGLYCDDSIAIRKGMTTIEKACVLAEELGHYYTSFGDIIDQSVVSNRKQEYRARIMAYNEMIGLSGLINAHQAGCSSLDETADFLNVTVDFMKEALGHFKSKYGVYKLIDHYVIYFEPSLGVFESI